MHREASGVYSTSVAGGETIRAFIPALLPPDAPQLNPTD